MLHTLARYRVAIGFGVALVSLVLARPSWTSLAMAAPLALAGECIRTWAAGHLEKGRGITTSGPYRWVRHPLYLGSSLMAVAFCVASRSWVATALVLAYMAVTVLAAMRTEEAGLRRQSAGAYEAYAEGQLLDGSRRFDMTRVTANREQRTWFGLGVIALLLALRAALT